RNNRRLVEAGSWALPTAVGSTRWRGGAEAAQEAFDRLAADAALQADFLVVEPERQVHVPGEAALHGSEVFVEQALPAGRGEFVADARQIGEPGAQRHAGRVEADAAGVDQAET